MNLQLQKNKDLKEFTTLGIGGCAAFFAEIQTKQELKEAFLFAKNQDLPVFILGGGSNLLFDDLGFSGLVIRNKIDFLQRSLQTEKELPNHLFKHPSNHPQGCSIQVGAGYSLTKLAFETTKQGFSGLEFALGIPASLGGAIYMNAGAFGDSISDLLQSVDFLFFNGEERTFLKSDLQFGYRFSSLQKLPGAIVGAELFLSSSSIKINTSSSSTSASLSCTASEKALAFLQQRQKKQPLNFKNAGSIFRNPKGLFAADLIEKADLKGFKIGGAEVSSLHANFIINQGLATSQDVLELIAHIKSKVFEKHQVQLEEEIVYVSTDGK